jgi:hypothetical protein
MLTWMMKDVAFGAALIMVMGIVSAGCIILGFDRYRHSRPGRALANRTHQRGTRARTTRVREQVLR